MHYARIYSQTVTLCRKRFHHCAKVRPWSLTRSISLLQFFCSLIQYLLLLEFTVQLLFHCKIPHHRIDLVHPCWRWKSSQHFIGTTPSHILLSIICSCECLWSYVNTKCVPIESHLKKKLIAQYIEKTVHEYYERLVLFSVSGSATVRKISRSKAESWHAWKMFVGCSQLNFVHVYIVLIWADLTAQNSFSV